MGISSVSIVTAMLAAAGLGAPAAAPSQWALRSIAPGGPLCRAEKSGDAVDTQIARNNADKLVLVVGHPDWEHNEAPVPMTISVDNGPAVSLDGTAIGPVVLVVIKDDTLTARLKTARKVTWNLPWGRFTARVEGLGEAFDSIAFCGG